MRRLYVLCNALDDATRRERGISTDSPAASHKVFALSRLLRGAGIRVYILSYGRGKQDGTGRYFPAVVRRREGVPLIYLPFINLPALSETLSLFAPAWALVRLRDRRGTLLFYNRIAAHLPALLAAKLLDFRSVLDLEDGEVGQAGNPAMGIGSRLKKALFDRLCSGGAMIACTALTNATSLRPALCYYGTVETPEAAVDWEAEKLGVLLGGTISSDTGATRLLEAVRELRREKPDWASNLRFEITGKGDCLPDFEALAQAEGEPAVRVHGRLDDAEYGRLLGRVHVGLALKPVDGKLASSTFPSKVIELSAAGLILVTTDISDVRLIFGADAVYLSGGGARELIDSLKWIEANRALARGIALRGALAVRRRCQPAAVGPALVGLLFGDRQ